MMKYLMLFLLGKNIKRLSPEVIKLKKKNRGFTNYWAEANTGGFSRTTVGYNTL